MLSNEILHKYLWYYTAQTAIGSGLCCAIFIVSATEILEAATTVLKLMFVPVMKSLSILTAIYQVNLG